MNAIAPGLGANVDHRIAFSSGARVENFILANQPHGECIHKRIARVTRLELGFATQVRHAEAVSVGGDSADHAFEDRVIFVQFRLRDNSWSDGRLVRPAVAKPGGMSTVSPDEGVRGSMGRNWSEAQRVHHRDWPRAHGENVPQDSPYTGSCALEWLDE